MIKSIRDVQPAEMPKEPEPPYTTLPKPARSQRLVRNCALTALLLITVTSVRNERLPSGQTVLTAVQTMTGEGWDDTLGRISFVSALVPDTVAVFGDGQASYSLYAPANGEMTHSWSIDEPYLSYRAGDGQVYALGGGQVMSVTADDENGYALRVRQTDGLEAMYYDLSAIRVREGDEIAAQACIGSCLRDAVVEVRRDGVSMDAAAWIQTP